MIEPIEIDENKKNEEEIPVIFDEIKASNSTESSDEITDSIELNIVNEESDASNSMDENTFSLDSSEVVDNELMVEEMQEENEVKKKIEELMATLERERVEHREEIKSLKNEIIALSPLPNFEKEMLEELIALREGYFRMKRNYEAKNGDFFDKDKTIRLIDGIASQIETILFNYSVEMSHSNISDPYNPRIHQAVKVIHTDDEAVSGTLESSLGELYIYKGRIIQKEKVNVYNNIKKEV